VTTAGQNARILYERPTSAGDSDGLSPEAMRRAFSDDIANLVEYHEAETDLVAVQGPVSSMKTWLLTHTAETFLDHGYRVVVLVPQKINRQRLIDRLGRFDVPYVEHPSRLDLCAWKPWKETVGHVDEQTCSTNGCSKYPDDQDIERLAEQALGIHRIETGGPVQLDEQTAKDLATKLDQPACPHYLLASMAQLVHNDEAVRVATYAKATEDAAANERLGADVALLDESHTIAADVSQMTTGADLPDITAALTAVESLLSDSARQRVQETASDIELLKCELEDWHRTSREQAVDPDRLFSTTSVTLTDAFDILRRADGIIMDEMRRSVRSHQDGTERLSNVYSRLRDITAFFSRIQRHRDGDLDFVHTRYEARGESVNEIGFRRVTDRSAASNPREVYEAWCEQGTHPAIEERWGGLLDHYIEALWSGRNMVPGGDRDVPGVPLQPLENLRLTTGADTLIGYSATHNEASDPTRPADDLRRTAHRLVTAPIQLRSDGDQRPDYHGQTSVDAATPWFRKLIQMAKERTDSRLAAVPINGTNKAKWEGMPVETIEFQGEKDGAEKQAGLVPHSRGAIGDKELENLPIDAVLCGVQVQGPADTARRLVTVWEQLAPAHEDPTAALERGWRLLAQHAVSGTIQAAGRFRTDAVNIIFERPGLIELAGFEHERLSPSMSGFPGEFAQLFESVRRNHQRQREAGRATRVVGYLERQESKAPTKEQYLSKFCEVYDATNSEATQAFEAAAEAGKLEHVAGMLRIVSEGEAGASPSS